MDYAEVLAFVLLIVAGALSSVMLMRSRELFKAAISLAIVFAVVAGFMLILSLTAIALFQLFILVGGLSTYLVVAVASDRHAQFRHVSPLGFSVAFVVLAAIFFYVLGVPSQQGLATLPNVAQEIAASLSGSIALIGAMIFLMFAAAIGSIIMMKRVVKMVV
ncbi:MAG: hypothetical protein KGH49_00225 [Candidatus Micrarchaeota archaeon]|nr:hypothetical protein [Candidatus Micrarchaeota archaeon]